MPKYEEQEALDLLVEALEKDATYWPAFLQSRCKGRPELEARVITLLEGVSEQDELPMLLLNHLAAFPHHTDQLRPLETRGPEGEVRATYQLLRVIGKGGMGVVYLADQLEPVRRRVAVKVMQDLVPEPSLRARFRREGVILARMQHRNVCAFLDHGRTSGDQPFLVMEYLDGAPLVFFARARGLSLEERLRLFLQVCRGVRHVHRKGVLHRDLKSLNVLVVQGESGPVAKVIDFGVAKILRGGTTEREPITVAGLPLGTPAYMSPEQARGLLNVDLRSDVYGLGTLLYELLVGAPLVDSEPSDPESHLQWQDPMDWEPPVPPSQRVAAMRQEGTGESCGLAPCDLEGNLDRIVLKCLEKDRDQRYRSVRELAQDIESHIGRRRRWSRPPRQGRRVIRRAGPWRLRAQALLLVLLMSVAFTLGGGPWLRAQAMPIRWAASNNEVVLRFLRTALHRTRYWEPRGVQHSRRGERGTRPMDATSESGAPSPPASPP